MDDKLVKLQSKSVLMVRLKALSQTASITSLYILQIGAFFALYNVNKMKRKIDVIVYEKFNAHGFYFKPISYS